MQIIESQSPEETEAAGESCARLLRPGGIIAYRGGLGMGKTTFTRGLARGLGAAEEAFSPTFALINEYRGGRLNLCHLDAYRLQSPEALLDTGFYDYLDMGWAAAVEWSENLLLTADYTITFTRTGENTRRITIEGEER